MNARNQGPQLRRIVARRLDRFFSAWIAQLAAGTSALWERVERRLADAPPQSDARAEDAPDATRVPMQQAPQHQPAQQQQEKKKDE